MFAPKVAKPQTKATEVSRGGRVLERSTAHKRQLAGVATRMVEDSWRTGQVSPPSVRNALQTSSTAMTPRVRSAMEAALHSDFSKVQIHANPEAAGTAANLGAAAYNSGNHIVFAPGQYAPDTDAGRRLLRHELAHVVQLRSGDESTVPTLRRDPVSERFADAWSSGEAGYLTRPTSCWIALHRTQQQFAVLTVIRRQVHGSEPTAEARLEGMTVFQHHLGRCAGDKLLDLVRIGEC